jgi:hypothetical protein
MHHSRTLMKPAGSVVGAPTGADAPDTPVAGDAGPDAALEAPGFVPFALPALPTLEAIGVPVRPPLFTTRPLAFTPVGAAVPAVPATTALGTTAALASLAFAFAVLAAFAFAVLAALGIALPAIAGAVSGPLFRDASMVAARAATTITPPIAATIPFFDFVVV